MDESVRQFVRQRAGQRCEYCQLPQETAPYITFHVEHIRAKQHHGDDDDSNLALACPDCNAKKGPNLTTVSPDTDEIIELFNPRLHSWDEHFTFVGPEIIGISDIGRATVLLLDFNEDERVVMRAELRAEGLF